MATVLLGSVLASTFGTVGKVAGAFLGQAIDGKVLGGSKLRENYNVKFIDRSSILATYGQCINMVYGRAPVKGSIIWASKIKEHHSAQPASGGKRGKSIPQKVDYYYTASLAVAVSAGPIASIDWIELNGIRLERDHPSLRIYLGTEDQEPDPLIEATEGVAPAYRGLAYFVIENLNLTDFDNSIPSIVCQVNRGTIKLNDKQDSLEELIEGIVVIPGSGEFVYDTEIRRKSEAGYGGDAHLINNNHTAAKADSVVSLDQLHDTLPNVKWVAPVVNWFGDSVDIGRCKIYPGVEHKSADDGDVSGVWRVAGYNRSTARIIGFDGNKIRYGGTPSDDSILNYLRELKRRGYKIMFYPMLLLDAPHKPWRGHIKGKADQVQQFFRGSDGYNKFILHYAQLVKGLADAFIIGSELIGLTGIHDGKDEARSFPAVDELIKLVNEVRSIMGRETLISYAADWSEYHCAPGGWYNLDPLWAADVDFIGIDAYFPLTNDLEEKNDLAATMAGFESGEGYDYYVERSENSEIKKPLEPPYAWKNIRWWWQNEHVNPDGRKTVWQAKSKKIWFTEYGFPSVHLATNQPNVFYSPDSIDGAFPRHSNGSVSIIAQRLGIEAVERWLRTKRDMIERAMLWTWDARPYPTWPQLTSLWADHGAYSRGHWVQGKLACTTLAQVLTDLCYRSQIDSVDVTKVYDVVTGMVINHESTAQSVIELLQRAYFFDITESEGTICFIPRASKVVHEIDRSALLPLSPLADSRNVQANSHSSLHMTWVSQWAIPSRVQINFLDIDNNYAQGHSYAVRQLEDNNNAACLNLPLCLNKVQAQHIAYTLLHNVWQEGCRYKFALPLQDYKHLKPGDVVKLEYPDAHHIVRAVTTDINSDMVMTVTGVQEDLSLYRAGDHGSFITPKTSHSAPLPDVATELGVFEVPMSGLTELGWDKGGIAVAAGGFSSNWPGCYIFYAFAENEREKFYVGELREATVLGRTRTPLHYHSPYFVDWYSDLEVEIRSSTLTSSKELFSQTTNIALVGEEIIHFQKADFIGLGRYRLKNLLRGVFDTEIKERAASDEVFTILSAPNVLHIPLSYKHIGKEVVIYAVTRNKSQALGEAAFDGGVVATSRIKFTGKCTKPLSITALTASCASSSKNHSNDDMERDDSDALVVSWDRRVLTENPFVAPADAHDRVFMVSLLREGAVQRQDFTPQRTYTIPKELLERIRQERNIWEMEVKEVNSESRQESAGIRRLFTSFGLHC